MTAMLSAGLKSLDWLMETAAAKRTPLCPIGSQGFYRKRGKARFDQQPLEAAAVVSACLEAFRVTEDARWQNYAWTAFNWFPARQ